MIKITCNTKQEKENILEIIYKSSRCLFPGTSCSLYSSGKDNEQICKDCINQRIEIEVIN